MISIVMPVLNGARFIDQAIASIVAQTDRRWELLVVDDGSDDDSLARAERWRALVAANFGEDKIRLLQTGGRRSGSQIARNLGVAQARFDLVAHLDMDDLYFPTRIESVVPMFAQFDLIFAPYQLCESGRLGLYSLHARWQLALRRNPDRQPTFEEWLHDEAQQRNVSIQLGAAHTRAMFDAVGGFQPGIIAASEGVLWRRMIERGARVGFCPVIAGRYNIRADSQARTRLPFTTGGFEIQQDHPLGANGQYLDTVWFAELAARRAGVEQATN
jgi:glycosyltransferase involved in cell wall biosynthesis